MPQSSVPLDRKKHASLTFRSLEDYSFTASMNMIPLLASEVADASRCFPVAFPLPGSPIPHALLGLGPTNIFLDGGRWTAPYLPFHAANYPFSLASARTPEHPDAPEAVLAIDETAPHFRQKNGAPLYGPDGTPTELLRRISTMMGNQHQMHKNSVPALNELKDSGVLREQTVTIRADGKARAVRGLRVADRDAVMALPDGTLARWVKNGLLEMLQAHWDSMRNLEYLLDALAASRNNISDATR